MRQPLTRGPLAGAGAGGRWRVLLGVVALVAAAAEAAAAVFLDVPLEAAILIGAMFVAGCFLLSRPSAVGPILIGLLSAIEVVSTPFYAGHEAADWVAHGAVGGLGLLGIVASVATLRADRRSRSETAPAH